MPTRPLIKVYNAESKPAGKKMVAGKEVEPLSVVLKNAGQKALGGDGGSRKKNCVGLHLKILR